MEEKVNILGSTIEIEDVYGNTKMIIEIDEKGNIVQYQNCDIADMEDENVIRLQQIDEEI